MIILSVIGVAIVVRRAAVLLPILIHGYRPPAAAKNPALAQFAALDDIFAWHSVLTMMHILPGLLFVTLGPLQFNTKLRGRHPRLHRVSGRIFLVAALIIGVTALVMSFAMPAIGGVLQAVATTVFSVYFLISLGMAFWRIRRREVAQHRRWMIRAFSIGIAVATIRPIIGMFFATSRITGWTPHQFFGVAFWIGFVLHAFLAEYWIRQTAPAAETVPLFG